MYGWWMGLCRVGAWGSECLTAKDQAQEFFYAYRAAPSNELVGISSDRNMRLEYMPSTLEGLTNTFSTGPKLLALADESLLAAQGVTLPESTGGQRARRTDSDDEQGVPCRHRLRLRCSGTFAR